jgi:copper(I)-binding protein
MPKRYGLTLAGLAGVLLVAAGCSLAPAPTPTPGLEPVLTIEGAYGLPLAAQPNTGEFFMVIRNTGMAADRLLSARSPACGQVELAQWVANADGSPGIAPLLHPLDIPAPGQTEFKEGGYYHLLCRSPQADQFKPGAKILLTLIFDTLGERRVSVEIRAAPAAAPP